MMAPNVSRPSGPIEIGTIHQSPPLATDEVMDAEIKCISCDLPVGEFAFYVEFRRQRYIYHKECAARVLMSFGAQMDESRNKARSNHSIPGYLRRTE